MKRRSFLQSIGAGIAALFVPAVAARPTGPVTPPHLTDPDAWYLIENQGGGKTLWVDGGNYRPDFWFRKAGTFSNPYRTLQKALDSCQAGDTIFVKSGHVEQFGVEIPLEMNSKIIGLGPNRPRITWQEPS